MMRYHANDFDRNSKRIRNGAISDDAGDYDEVHTRLCTYVCLRGSHFHPRGGGNVRRSKLLANDSRPTFWACWRSATQNEQKLFFLKSKKRLTVNAVV